MKKYLLIEDNYLLNQISNWKKINHDNGVLIYSELEKLKNNSKEVKIIDISELFLIYKTSNTTDSLGKWLKSQNFNFIKE